jgi:hypothetical protein
MTFLYMNRPFQSGNDIMTGKKEDSHDADDGELSGAEIDGLIQYFGIDSVDNSESLVQGIKTLVRLARS